MPSPTQLEGQSQGPSSPSPVSSEWSRPYGSKGKKRHRSEQDSDSHQQISSPKLEDSSSKSQKNERSVEGVDVSTLPDTKGGLDSLSRVDQLVSFMQQVQNDCSNKSDEITKRINIAGLIAATEQGDCLKHFIDVGGLRSLNDWIQEACKGKVSDSENKKEELICASLNVLEKLPMDQEALKGSSIGKSVKQLCNHKNIEIQRKARNVVDIWKKQGDVEMEVLVEPKVGSTHGSVQVHFGEGGILREGTDLRCTKAANSAVIEGNCGGCSDEEASASKVQQNSISVNIDWLAAGEAKDRAMSVCQQDCQDSKEVGTMNLNRVVMEEGVSKPSYLESSSNKSCLDAEEMSVHCAEDVPPTCIHSSPKEKDSELETIAEAAEPMELGDDLGGQKSEVHAGEWTGISHMCKATDRHTTKESQLGLVASTEPIHGQEICSPSADLKVPIKASDENPDSGSPKGMNGCLISSEIADMDKRTECSQKKRFQLNDSSSINTSMMSSINSSFSDHKPSYMPLKTVDDSSRYRKGLREPTSECGVVEGCETRNSNSTEDASGTSYSAGNQEDTRIGVGDGDYRKYSAMVTSLYGESASRINMEENSTGIDEGNKASKRWPEVEQNKSEEDARRSTEIDLQFVEDDALEVARQVAKEVEQEVESYNEPLCSSSEKEVKGEPVHLNTTESVGGENDLFLAQVYNEKEPQEHITNSCYSSKEETDFKAQSEKDNQSSQEKYASEETAHCSFKLKHSTQESESCKMTIISQESITGEAQTKTADADDHKQTLKRCIFDLNEDIPTEEGESLGELIHPPAVATASASNCNNATVSTPIPVVAASKGPVTLPTSPLHFKGELGWRGSAATSAFRPAEPRRTPERGRTQSAEENNSPLKPGRRLIEIDLNVADDDGNVAMDLFSGGIGGERNVPASTSLPSCDSSVEVSSSRRAERLNWDLNRLGESDDSGPALPSDWRDVERSGALQKPDRSPSPTSSSRPAMRDFDLNDNISFEDASASAYDSQQTGYKYNMKSNNNPSRLDDPLVSILGPKIDADFTKLPPAHLSSLAAPWDISQSNTRKDFPNAAQSFLVSGPSSVSPLGNMGRMLSVPPALTYSPPQLSFPYNGLALGSSFPISSAVFTSGHVPYMVDSLGAPISPQILGPTNIPSFTKPPYLMGVASGVGTSNTNGIMRPNLDLNSGGAPNEAEGREVGGNMKQFFLPGSSHILSEEPMRVFQPVAASGSSSKRKESEGGWEAYQVGYKQATTWR